MSVCMRGGDKRENEHTTAHCWCEERCVLSLDSWSNAGQATWYLGPGGEWMGRCIVTIISQCPSQHTHSQPSNNLLICWNKSKQQVSNTCIYSVTGLTKAHTINWLNLYTMSCKLLKCTAFWWCLIMWNYLCHRWDCQNWKILEF